MMRRKILRGFLLLLTCVAALLLCVMVFPGYLRSGQALTQDQREWNHNTRDGLLTHSVGKIKPKLDQASRDSFASDHRLSSGQSLRNFSSFELTSERASVMKSRRDRVERICKAEHKHFFEAAKGFDMHDEHFVVDEQHHLLQCNIYKVASSFLLRIFYVLNNRQNPGFFNVSSEHIHESMTRKLTPFEQKTFIQKANWILENRRFFFVRDPYERIFSAWVDKFFVPFSLVYVLDEMVTFLAAVDQKPLRSQWRKAPKMCGMARGLSFTDLVRFVTSAPVKRVDQHMKPYHLECFPCHLHYDYIGKVETMKQDVDFILRSVNVNTRDIYDDENDESFQEKNAVNFMSGVVERVFSKRPGTGCDISRYNTMQRIWVAFQIRGYISLNISLPVTREAEKHTTVEMLQKLAAKAYRDTTDHKAAKTQRRQAFLEAYHSLPRPLLQKLQAYVADDCKLFDYDCDIESRFNASNKPTKDLFHFNELMFSKEYD